MSLSTLGNLNWLAVVVAAIAWFILGAIWYAPPVMGKIWMAAAGLAVPDGQKPSPIILAVTLVAYLIAAAVTGALAAATGTDTLGEGVVLGVMLGVGYALTAALVAAVYEKKPEPAAYILVNGIYNTLGLTIVGAIVAIWH